ncbi:MAG: hypothetical protein ACK551_00355 [Vampirovibrionales bacterium]
MIPTVTRYSPSKPSTSAQPALPLSTNPTPSPAVHQRSGFTIEKWNTLRYKFNDLCEVYRLYKKGNVPDRVDNDPNNYIKDLKKLYDEATFYKAFYEELRQKKVHRLYTSEEGNATKLKKEIRTSIEKAIQECIDSGQDLDKDKMLTLYDEFTQIIKNRGNAKEDLNTLLGLWSILSRDIEEQIKNIQKEIATSNSAQEREFVEQYMRCLKFYPTRPSRVRDMFKGLGYLMIDFIFKKPNRK